MLRNSNDVLEFEKCSWIWKLFKNLKNVHKFQRCLRIRIMFTQNAKHVREGKKSSWNLKNQQYKKKTNVISKNVPAIAKIMIFKNYSWIRKEVRVFKIYFMWIKKCLWIIIFQKSWTIFENVNISWNCEIFFKREHCLKSYPKNWNSNHFEKAQLKFKTWTIFKSLFFEV